MTPNKKPVDLSTCDKEPIHQLGMIQSHGFMLVIHADTFEIEQLSANAGDFLQLANQDILGKSVQELSFQGLIEVLKLSKLEKPFESLNPSRIYYTLESGAIIVFDLIAHQSDAVIILEFETISNHTVQTSKLLNAILDLINRTNSLQWKLDKVADLVKEISDYDRVMIYRFAEDGHGEVISESKEPDMQPFLGLHYPASDIPAQARRLYIENRVRLIADVKSAPVELHPLYAPSLNKPTDLSQSQLRAVSPIHIQYLKNMGVGASFSISIVVENKLWGLIACHHNTPCFLTYDIRQSCKFVGEVISIFIQSSLAQEDAAYKLKINEISKGLAQNMRAVWNVTHGLGLAQYETTVMDMIDCDGAAVIFDNDITLLGKTPTESDIKLLVDWLQKVNRTQTFYQTDRLPLFFPVAKNFKNYASGLLSITLSAEMNEYIMWFKPEQKQRLAWGGDPNKPVEVSEDGALQLSPRKSFEKWEEETECIAAPWKQVEIAAVLKLRQDILEIMSSKTNEIRKLNENLTHATKELEAFSYTISHDLKTPLFTINSYAELLLDDYGKELSPGALNYLNKIMSNIGKMNALIRNILHYSRSHNEILNKQIVDMNSLLSDIIGDNKSIKCQNTPELYGDTAMIGQVFQNLISNALKYSAKKERIEVMVNGWEEGHFITYCVADNGIGIDMKYADKIFEIFNRLHTAEEYEGHGVGLAIVKRIIERHQGKIWFESKLNIGTTFYISLPKPA